MYSADTVERSADLVDAVGLDGRVDELSHKFALQILQRMRSRVCPTNRAPQSRTSKKNFLAPTLSAFFSAAAKSCAGKVPMSILAQ